MTDSNLLNTLIIKSIEEDSEDLQKYLQRIPLIQITPTAFYDSLEKYLKVAMYSGNRQAIRLLIETFEDSNLLNDKIPLFTELFRHPEFSEEILKFMIPIFDDFTLYEHITNLIDYDDDDLSILAAARLNKLYRSLSLSNYKDLEAVAREQQHQHLYQFIEAIIQEISPSAPKPKWVKNYLKKEELPTELEVWNKLPKEKKIDFTLPSIADSVDMLTQGLHAQGELDFDIEESRRFLTQLLSTAPLDDRLELLRPIFTTEHQVDLKDDKIIFRILGPVNAVIDANLTSEAICSKYGGDRMFTCNEFEVIDVEDDSEDFNVDWFTGNCQQCNLKIDNRYWAVRRPLAEGGWKGCYCSWKCVREEVIIPSCNDVEMCSIEEEERVDPNLAMQAIITRIEANMNRIGIQDRRVVGEFKGAFPKAYQRKSPEV